MRRRILSILALAAVLIVTFLVDTGFGSPAHPLGSLLGRAETVLVVRMASRTETNAVFEVTQVLRGDAKLQKLSLGRSLAGRDLPKNTQSLLLFSQGDNYWGPPKDSFQAGQPIKGQASYRGWILIHGPGQSKEELQRLKQLVKQNPYKPDLHGKSSDKNATLRDLAVSALMAKLRAERDAEVADVLGREILARFEDSWIHGGPPSIAEDAKEYQLPRQVVQTLADDFESFVKIPPARKPDCVSSWRIGDFVYVHGFTMEEKGRISVTSGPDGTVTEGEWWNEAACDYLLLVGENDKEPFIVARGTSTECSPATEPARQPAVDAAGRRLSDKTMEAVKQLKTSLSSESFDICLDYFGPERGEAVHSLLLQREDQIACPPLSTLIAIGIPKERAGQIIVHLAELGFFDRAKDVDLQRTPRRTGILKGPTYVLTVESLQKKKGYNYYLDLGWNWQMLQFLDGFRKGLVGEEAKAMDKLLAQLQPERKRWQAAEEARIERLLSILRRQMVRRRGTRGTQATRGHGPRRGPVTADLFQEGRQSRSACARSTESQRL